MSDLAEKLRQIREKVDRIANDCGRRPGEIRVVAVSKTFGEDVIREALSAGQTEFGENYAAEFHRKVTAINDIRVQWHFIGHLQSNKARLVVGSASLIHSLDRLSLAREIQKRAEQVGTTVEALIEVHTTNEDTKSGVDPEALASLASSLRQFDRIRLRGLMTMGPFTSNPEDSRGSFRLLRDLFIRLKESLENPDSFNTLSMGMTSDYPVAIEEGSTLLRIGTAIFGQRSTTV